jgi:glycosyltransferase involved in cell wall biosynthesis
VALGGADVFHHTSRILPPVASAAESIAVAEIPPAGSREEALLARALERADGVLVFGASAAKRLRDRFGVDPARLRQVAVGCDHARRSAGAAGPREPVPRILALGPVAEHRRPLRLLRAFELLVEEGLHAHLHFVGAGEAELDRALDASKVRLRIARDRRLPEPELWSLVARSSVLVHLVEDAATPVTPLEAFSLGTPVVASRLPAFEEALGGRAELVLNGEIDHAPDVLAEAIERALRSASDPEACAGRERIARGFTWERCARETVELWCGLRPSRR